MHILRDYLQNIYETTQRGDAREESYDENIPESLKFELLMVMHFYQIGQLRKSEGLAEAVRRGLREPLSS